MTASTPSIEEIQDSYKFHLECPQHLNWYALFLRSRFEKKAHCELLRRGFESFLPLIQETHAWSDRQKRVSQPLFQGYVFVQTDLREKVSVLQIPGVVRFVGIGAKPSRIPDYQIEWIRTFIGSRVVIRRESYPSVGQRVKVVSGLFQGIEGSILRSNGSTRIVICLDSIRQSVSIEVPPHCVEEIAGGAVMRLVQQRAFL